MDFLFNGSANVKENLRFFPRPFTLCTTDPMLQTPDNASNVGLFDTEAMVLERTNGHCSQCNAGFRRIQWWRHEYRFIVEEAGVQYTLRSWIKISVPEDLYRKALLLADTCSPLLQIEAQDCQNLGTSTHKRGFDYAFGTMTMFFVPKGGRHQRLWNGVNVPCVGSGSSSSQGEVWKEFSGCSWSLQGDVAGN